ncbi:MAG: flagellin, partial [Planctomycetes bacterium]|nr:flagellin [Planctomycetota bacterium]
MSMIIRNNIAAINANRNLNASQSSLTSSLEKLSSGYRINKGSDGPADLVISEQLRAQISGLERAVRNTNEATNVLSIAEGALNEMNSILKNMKALAIHAASDGVTSSEQIEADQAEMDSYIQTLQRIADTTKYSDEMLLNGNKELTYSVSTEIKGTQNNQLVDHGTTDFTQIYKRDGYTVSFGFTGATNADNVNNIGDADMSKQAMKAYMEIDTVANTLSQIDEDGYLTQSQSFILTGAYGSRQFNFAAGASITQVVTAIQSYADSTGVDASLIFNSNQMINQSALACSATVSIGITDANGAITGTTGLRSADDITVYENYYIDEDGNRQVIVEDIGGNLAASVHYGYNTDGQGRIYIKCLGDGKFELYKDADFTEANLIGVGDSNGNITERNNSGIDGLTINVSADAKYGQTAYISVGNVILNANNVVSDGIMAGDKSACSSSSGAAADGTFSLGNSTASGVQLGVNTDANGKIYFKVVTDENGLSTVYAYNDASMSSNSLVAMSEEGIELNAGNAVILNAIWNDDGTASTGLGLHLNISGSFSQEGTLDGWMQFTNLGARISSTDYGSDAFIQVQQSEGGLFTYYDQADSASSATLVDAGGTGVTVRITGQDATINVNGQQMKTNGLKLDMATTDIMA